MSDHKRQPLHKAVIILLVLAVASGLGWNIGNWVQNNFVKPLADKPKPSSDASAVKNAAGILRKVGYHNSTGPISDTIRNQSWFCKNNPNHPACKEPGSNMLNGSMHIPPFAYTIMGSRRSH